MSRERAITENGQPKIRKTGTTILSDEDVTLCNVLNKIFHVVEKSKTHTVQVTMSYALPVKILETTRNIDNLELTVRLGS